MVDQYKPIITLDVYGSATYRKSTRPVVISGVAYNGGIITFPDLQEDLPDITIGVDTGRSVRVRLTNVDNGIDDTWTEIVAAEELRGRQAKLSAYDEQTATTIFLMRGTIANWEDDGESFNIEISAREDVRLATLLPQKLITTDEFTATAMDVGAPINVVLGYKVGVPLYNIQNDRGNDYFDYLIGYGPIEGLMDSASWMGVRYKDKRGKITASQYTLYDGTGTSAAYIALGSDPYPGYAWIRFRLEQYSWQGYLNIVADIKGLLMGGASAQRDPIMSIKHVLTNSTWGLGDTADATSFSNASTALAAIATALGKTFTCDGILSSQRQALDILNDMCLAFRCYLFRGADGEWEIGIVSNGASVLSLYENEPGKGTNCTVKRRWARDVNDCTKTLTLHYDMDKPGGPYIIRETVRTDYGVDKLVQLPFIGTHDSAFCVLDYLDEHEEYTNEFIEVEGGPELKSLSRGQVFTLTSSRYGISAADYKVTSASKDHETKFTIQGCQVSAGSPTLPGVPTDIDPSDDEDAVPYRDPYQWQTVVSEFTAIPGQYYSVDTSGGAFTCHLPASPLNNDVVIFENVDETWEDDNFTIDGNGNSIEWGGVSYDEVTCDINGLSVVMKFNGTVWKVL